MFGPRILVVSLALAVFAGCSSEPAKKEPAPASAAGGKIAVASRDGGRPPIGLPELEPRGLEKRWDFNLGDPIAGMWLLDDSLYVYTETKREKSVYSIRVEDGLTRWKYDVPDGITFGPASYVYEKDGLHHTDEVFLVSRDTLHCVDRDHGFLLWKKELPFAVSSPPAASISHCYVGSWDGRVYAIAKDDHSVEWSYRTGAPVSAQPEATKKATESIYVGSEDGRVYSMSPVEEARKWLYDTHAPVTAKPFFFKTYIFVGSRDFNLYCIRSIDGGLEWRYPTGAPITREPIAFSEGDTVFVVSGESNLLAVNRRPDPKSKEYLRWKYEKGLQILAKGRRDVYVLDTDGRVSALADQTGKARWAEPLRTGADYMVTDPFDPASLVEREKRLASMIVLGYKNGWLIAAKEKSEY